VEAGDPAVERLLSVRDAWSHSNWDAAFYFNWATRDYKFLDYAEPDALEIDHSIMESYLLSDPRPPNFKSYHSTPIKFATGHSPITKVPLPQAVRFEQANDTKIQSVTFSDLGVILFSAAGLIGEKPWPGQGSFLRKTVPSGGARHPTEVYVANLGISELPAGVYHYNVEQHGLDEIERAQTSSALYEQVKNAISDVRDRVKFAPQAVLILTSVLERSMWRYRDSRSFRVILIDAGHVVMNFRCACESLGLTYFCGHGFSDDKVAAILKLDGTTEIPLLITMV
jgi:SagB-type dehydrogenase family enzyme